MPHPPTRPFVATSALVAILAIGGCGADSHAAHSYLTGLRAPSSDWSPGGHGLTRFGSGALRHEGRIWVLPRAGGSAPTYVGAWQVKVDPGHEGQRCEQAARWLIGVGKHTPGSPVSGGAKAPGLESSVVRCLQQLHPLGQGSTASTEMVSWPDIDNAGYRYHLEIGSDISGSDVEISASVTVAPVS